jgi:hypothetical protein
MLQNMELPTNLPSYFSSLISAAIADTSIRKSMQITATKPYTEQRAALELTIVLLLLDLRCHCGQSGDVLELCCCLLLGGPVVLTRRNILGHLISLGLNLLDVTNLHRQEGISNINSVSLLETHNGEESEEKVAYIADARLLVTALD